MATGFKVGNPTMNERTFEHRPDMVSTDPMTMQGTIQKSGILLLLTMVTAVFGWQLAPTGLGMPIMIGSLLFGLGIAIATTIKKEWSPFLAPAYALIKGLFVGVLSYIANEVVADSDFAMGIGAIPLAVAGTLVVFGVMLALYATRIIKVTERFRLIVVGATAAVFILYMGTFLIGLFTPAAYNLPIYGSGPIGIIFSVLVIALAAFNLALDFDLIENGTKNKLPKYFEWYAGFALLVTVIWLYIEILRLIMKLASSNR